MHDRLTIVKVGGKVVEEPDALSSFIKDFASIAGQKILVHGGGRSATAIANQLGIETKMVEGRRITDKSMLDVVVMVYGGLVNKNVVAQLQALNKQAVGLTGADLDLVRAVKRPVKDIDYGYAGDVTAVNTEHIEELIANGVVPVVAPLTHNGQGQLLNTNADTMAAELAKAFAKIYRVQLVYCFEKKGVLEDPSNDNSVITHLSYRLFDEYKQSGVINEGMIPKLDNGFSAIKHGVSEVFITNIDGLKTGFSTGTQLSFNE
ncbi:acetylglutamate kinase [Carboxylicivirga sediminis]|uniref:Acetylglutamate kinase n=1 Tax=Carboxylicivirga sediminis TaxID=2006564 RepID=A0A941IZD1_9BACT|nr:acetylglutamate kinase [Carboxylicivirga sediminis]MBR8536577.1 acetylglutamate kinase [Carboxylicivirga sediminis]